MEGVFQQFISEKRSEVSKSVDEINEILRNHNFEAAKYLIHARDIVYDDNLRKILNVEIDRLLNDSADDEEIQSMAMQAIINLEKLATIATEECVIKYWNDYIGDVLKGLHAIDVHHCFTKHDVMNCAMVLEKKVH
jgi:uncharacterized protein YPO0396